MDPLTKSYPMLTPYQFASNRPIDGIDLDGLEYYYFMSNINRNGQKNWKLVKTQDIIKMTSGIGDFSFKLSKAGIKADFAYYDADCSWRLVPEYFTQFSLNNITDEQWQSFATIDEIELKVKSLNAIGNKAETAVAVASLFDGFTNLYKGVKGIEAAKITRNSVDDKLERYLLNLDHPVGGSKAKWFKEALGFTKENMDGLAKQIVFNLDDAVKTGTNKQGDLFKQMIDIKGANGKIISTQFNWIKHKNGDVKLVGSIPSKK